jgi:alpha-L-fucosidase
VLLNVGPRADGSLHELQVAALESLGEFMAEHKAHLAGSRGLGELGIDGVEWARAVEKDGVCHVFLSGEAGETRIAAAALPAGYDWPTDGVEATLSGEDAAPVALAASRTA